MRLNLHARRRLTGFGKSSRMSSEQAKVLGSLSPRIEPDASDARGVREKLPRRLLMSSWTRREFLTRTGVAAAVIQTFDNLDPCCVFAADAKTADKDLFELKPVADG